MSLDEIVCGLDEVGRGALAGPIVAAAVILPRGFNHPLLRDSKLLSARQREAVAAVIREKTQYRLCWLGPRTIDRLGIQRCNKLIFETLIESMIADVYLVDGNLTLSTLKPYRSVIHGEASVPAIAAASIIAKVSRDQYMTELGAAAPIYEWNRNRGYGTKAHMTQIRLHGTHPEHRLSFHIPSSPQTTRNAGRYGGATPRVSSVASL